MSIIWWTAGVNGMDAPAIFAMRGLQMPQAMTTYSVSMSPWSVRTRVTRPSSVSTPVTSTPAAIARAPISCAAWRVEAAENDLLVDERDHPLDLGRREQADALDAPGLRGRHPALQLLHPLRRPGDLDAAALVVHAELAVLDGAVHRERGHLLVVVGQEDEVGGMAGGAAGG